MPRNMSFALTIPQMRAKTKTVTRRDGWRNLSPGTLLWAVEKAMGLKRGETVQRIGLIRVVEVRAERLDAITQAEVIAEGFPRWTPEQFVDFFCTTNGVPPEYLVTRIEFRHMRLDPEMPIAVPEKLAVCPICGGKLTITACDAGTMYEPGLWTPEEITTECEHMPDIDSDEWVAWNAWHYNMPYVDWLPVDTKILRWFQRTVRYLK